MVIGVCHLPLSVDDEALRGLFDAMRLEVNYNKLTDKVGVRVTVDAQSVDSLSRAVTLAGRQAGNGQGKIIRPDVTLVRRAPNGIRTRVSALKGRRPRPLDDGGFRHESKRFGPAVSAWGGETDDYEVPIGLPWRSQNCLALLR